MTEPDRHGRPSWRQHPSTPILAGVAVTLVWALLAWIRPTTTWHLAPLLVVLAPSWTAEQLELPRRLRWAAAETVLALAATAVLEVTGMLTGQVPGCSSPTD